MNMQVSILLVTKPLSNQPFCNFSYDRCAASDWTHGIFFNLITKSQCPPSLLKTLGSSMKTVSPLGIYYWVKAFENSIIWLFKPRIQHKTNINLTVAHCTTGEYEFKGSGYSIFWKCPITKYCGLNFLITKLGFLFYLKDHVTESMMRLENDSLRIIFHMYVVIRLWIS